MSNLHPGDSAWLVSLNFAEPSINLCAVQIESLLNVHHVRLESVAGSANDLAYMVSFKDFNNRAWEKKPANEVFRTQAEAVDYALAQFEAYLARLQQAVNSAPVEPNPKNEE